jgi:tetratricopeptide (TPR) repeat protein
LPEKTKNAEVLYEFIGQYSLAFLNAYVKRDDAALELLKKKPEEWNNAANLITSQIRAGAQAPPREWEFVDLIHAGNFDRAKEIYEGYKSKNPTTNFFREQTLNALGYEYLFRGNPDLAIKILAMNAGAFPSSANALDSLSEVYEAAGNTKMALEVAQKGMDLLSRDSSMDAQRKASIQNSLEKRIKKLQPM